jgi:hypothetical protein
MLLAIIEEPRLSRSANGTNYSLNIWFSLIIERSDFFTRQCNLLALFELISSNQKGSLSTKSNMYFSVGKMNALCSSHLKTTFQKMNALAPLDNIFGEAQRLA